MSNMWKIFALLSACFAALTAILAKMGLKGINSNLATAIRCIVIVIIAWGIVGFSGEFRDIRNLTKNNLVFLVLSGLATGLSWIFYFKALAAGPVSKVAPIDKLSVALTICISVIFFKEPLDWKLILGGLMIIGGTLVMVL